MTSQRCIAKELITPAGLEEIHLSMQQSLAAETGFHFDDILAFTGLPPTLTWEKPSPDMIQVARDRHSIDLDNSWIIGDADRDIAMGLAAGVNRSIRVVTDKPVGVKATHTVSSMTDAATVLRIHLPESESSSSD